jgi:hypothetical protein
MSELGEWRERYDQAMAEAEATYADVTDALRQLEVPARIEQTGGMCLAIQWETRNGYYMLTDFEDSLPWDREQLTGWTLGRYDEEGDVVGDYAQVEDPSVEAAVELVVRTVLGDQP